MFVFKGLKRVLQTMGRRKRARYYVEGTTLRDENLQGRGESLAPIDQPDTHSERDNTDSEWPCLLKKIKGVLLEINALVEQTLLQKLWTAPETRAVPNFRAAAVLDHNDGPSKDQQETGHTKQGALCPSRSRSACARCEGCKSSMLDTEDSSDRVRHGSPAPLLQRSNQQIRKTVQWANGTKSGDDEAMNDYVPARVRLRKKSRRVSKLKVNEADKQ